MSAAVRARGMDAIPVDIRFNRHVQKVRCIIIDFSTDEGLNLIMQIMDSPLCLAVHIAPPCGTASRARERPLASHLLAKGFKSPRPLRSSDFPGGIPGISEQDTVRVQAANAFYRNSIKIFKFCLAGSILCTVENPTRSWMWHYDEWPILLTRTDVFSAIFQNCMHGGNRDKWSTWVSTSSRILALSAVCDNSHMHKPWGATGDTDNKRKLNYATAEEAAYPTLLCERVVDIYIYMLPLQSQKELRLLHMNCLNKCQWV